MKKIISFIMTILVTFTMLFTFVMPAYAESQFVGYNDREYKNNEVVTTAKTVDATLITPDMAVWGTNDNDTPSWYTVIGTVTLTVRPEVLGDVRLILCDNAVLKAPNGITLEEGHSLTVYSQSDDDKMGKLVIENFNGNTTKLKAADAAIGGRGGNGTYDDRGRGEKGTSAGALCWKGGNLTITAPFGACIGGGNGGNGGAGFEMGGNGGDGGNGADMSVYGGTISLDGSYGISGGRGGDGGTTCWNAGGSGGFGGCGGIIIVYTGNLKINANTGVCIGGGNTGAIGSTEDGSPTKGFKGGNGGSVSLIGGTVELQSSFKSIGGGKGGKGGESNCLDKKGIGPDGSDGDPATITLGNGMAVYNRNNDGTRGALVTSDNISKTLDGMKSALIVMDNTSSFSGSILSFGYPWIVIVIPVLAIIAVAVLIIVKKKNKAALAGDTENIDEE